METINHECYVSLEIAKLLKEVRFNWGVKTYYHYLSPYDEYNLEFDSISTNYNHLDNADFSAPTLDVAQRWLREVKNCYTGIDVFVRNPDKNNTYYNRWFVYFNGTRYSGSNYDDTPYYEEAQEAGIKKALEMILEKEK